MSISEPLTGPAAQGLHRLKQEWRQKSYLERYCRELLERLDAELEETFAAAPQRSVKQTFRLCPPPGSRLLPEEMGRSKAHAGVTRPSEERLLEAALFARYGTRDGRPTPGLWALLVGYQIPLFNSAARAGWGHVDLLGLTERGDPVIVELKKAGSSDTPLLALLEAASYAVALRKNWELLYSELCASGFFATAEPEEWNLVLLAPTAYWDLWTASTPRGRKVTDTARGAYRELCHAFEARRMPVRVGQVDGLEEWGGTTALEGERLSVSEVHPTWFIQRS